MHAGAVDAVDPDEFISEAVDQLAERLNGRRAELSKDRDALYALIDEVLLPRLDRELAARQVLPNTGGQPATISVSDLSLRSTPYWCSVTRTEYSISNTIASK